MKIKILILALTLALSLGVVGVAFANGGVEQRRQVLGGGASDSVAGDTALRATLGQPMVGVISGGDVSIGQGFWHGGATYSLYLPLVLRSR